MRWHDPTKTGLADSRNRPSHFHWVLPRKRYITITPILLGFAQEKVHNYRPSTMNDDYIYDQNRKDNYHALLDR